MNQFTYTAQFGNGVSGTLSAQDPTAYTQAGLLNLTGATAGWHALAARTASTTIAGTRFPDLIGSAPGRSGLGSVPVVGCALTTTTPATTAATETDRSPRRQVGLGRSGCLADQEHPDWCGRHHQLAGRLHRRCNPLQPARAWLRSASRCSAAPTWLAPTRASASPTLRMPSITGTTAANGTGLENVKTWGFRGGFNHNWDPYWSTRSLRCLRQRSATATTARPPSAPVCVLALLGRRLATCNPDFNIAQLGSDHPLDPCEEPDVLGRLHLDPCSIRSTRVRLSLRRLAALAKPAAVYELRIRTASTSCSALSATCNPVRLIDRLTEPPAGNCRGFSLRGAIGSFAWWHQQSPSAEQLSDVNVCKESLTRSSSAEPSFEDTIAPEASRSLRGIAASRRRDYHCWVNYSRQVRADAVSGRPEPCTHLAQ